MGLKRASALFMGAFISNPRATGALLPSSSTLARQMTASFQFSEQDRIVELGVGTGAFTEHLLAKLGCPSQYLGIELNKQFVKYLQQAYPSASFICSDAAHLSCHIERKSWQQVDYIFSGLPFANLPLGLSAQIIDAVAASCAPQGFFITFQYLHAMKFKSAIEFRKMVGERFGPLVSSKVVLPNLFPAAVLTWQRD